MGAYVYILRCRDGKYYVGSTRDTLEKRVTEHNAGILGGFTSSCRPVELVFSQYFDRITDAISAERQLKGWSRAKKEALMRGDFEGLKLLSKARREAPHPSTRMRDIDWRRNIRPDLVLSLSKHEAEQISLCRNSSSWYGIERCQRRTDM